MFTARYGLMPYIKHTFLFNGLISLVFVIEVGSVYSAVRTDALYKTYVSSLKG